jgi:hypothetical protein
MYMIYRAGNESREIEPVGAEQVLQWRRECEAEIAKRGRWKGSGYECFW